MLVLSRKLNERIVVTGACEITVVDLSHGRVRLGIHAAKDVKIHRQEVWDEINRELAQASEQPQPEDI